MKLEVGKKYVTRDGKGVEPLTRDVWLNVVKIDDELSVDSVGLSQRDADNYETEGRVACIKVTLVEGQFDD